MAEDNCQRRDLPHCRQLREERQNIHLPSVIGEKGEGKRAGLRIDARPSHAPCRMGQGPDILGKIRHVPPMTEIDVLENTRAVEAKIAIALAQAERPDDAVCLTIVSKTFPAERITPLLDAGYRTFGENRVQEAQRKWPDLKAAYPDIRLHLIGSLQTNKSDDAVALFDVIETLDREKLARSLARSMEKLDRRPDLFVQVNTGDEPQKGGVDPKEAVAFATWCKTELNLPIVGLMAIPPAEDVPSPHFALLKKLTDEAGLPRVSMGMSGDYDIAAQLGATDVRVGSAIFGARG